MSPVHGVLVRCCSTHQRFPGYCYSQTEISAKALLSAFTSTLPPSPYCFLSVDGRPAEQRPLPLHWTIPGRIAIDEQRGTRLRGVRSGLSGFCGDVPEKNEILCERRLVRLIILPMAGFRKGAVRGFPRRSAILGTKSVFCWSLEQHTGSPAVYLSDQKSARKSFPHLPSPSLLREGNPRPDAGFVRGLQNSYCKPGNSVRSAIFAPTIGKNGMLVWVVQQVETTVVE